MGEQDEKREKEGYLKGDMQRGSSFKTQRKQTIRTKPRRGGGGHHSSSENHMVGLSRRRFEVSVVVVDKRVKFAG